MLDLADADELPLLRRRFRPPAEGATGRTHRVEVVFAARVGPDTLAACRGLDDPAWHYEVITPLALVVGQVGTVRNLGFYRNFPPRWIFTPGPEDPP